jgi:glycosyltransferase involved in cell wall biosynthesis
MSKMVFVTAVPETISSFLLIYINSLAEDHDVHIATSLPSGETVRGLSLAVTTHNVNIARNPDVFSDLKSLWQLFLFFKKEKFDVVHSFTPKAGLLAQISSFFARSPIRFHTFTGQVWATKTGIARTLLKQLDKVTATLATFCLVDSVSQQNFLIHEEIVTEVNSQVLANGSISGININKFSFSQETRQRLRDEHNVKEDEFVFLYVGRLKKEKGIPELINGFTAIKTEKSVKLFIIGSDEENLAHLFENHSNIEYIGFKTNISEYYSFADTLCLPSHREGFGNVIIEAAACNLPAIASNIYGLCDAVEDGYSGLLHDVKNENSITSSMEKMVNNEINLSQMRKDARMRVEEVFDEQHLLKEFLTFYDKFIGPLQVGVKTND